MNKILKSLAASALVAASATAMASPVQYGFVLAGTGFSASGILTPTSTGTAGSYLVTGISGFENGTRIDGLLAPGTYGANDNTLIPAGSPPTDIAGIAFTAGGHSFNLYNASGALGSPVNMGLCSSATSAACLLVSDGAPVTSFFLGIIHQFAYSMTGSGFSGSGVLSAIDTGAGHYAVLGITGEQDGMTIGGLLAPGTYGLNDNTLIPAGTPPADVAGIAFTAGGLSFDLYNASGALRSPVNMGLCSSATSANCLLVTDGAPVTTFSLQEIPEPATAALSVLGLLAVSLARRRTSSVSSRARA